jgi:hypothetical protein
LRKLITSQFKDSRTLEKAASTKMTQSLAACTKIKNFRQSHSISQIKIWDASLLHMITKLFHRDIKKKMSNHNFQANKYWTKISYWIRIWWQWEPKRHSQMLSWKNIMTRQISHRLMMILSLVQIESLVKGFNQMLRISEKISFCLGTFKFRLIKISSNILPWQIQILNLLIQLTWVSKTLTSKKSSSINKII